MVPRVLETDAYIEMADTDKSISVADALEGRLEISLSYYDDWDGDTHEVTLGFTKADLVRFLDEVVKKFDGN